MSIKELEKVKTQVEKNMRKAAAELNFEEAAQLRDKMIEINKYIYEGKNMADSKLKKEIERGSYKNCIRIKGAREHNLKGIDVDIPRDKLVVLTDFQVQESRVWHLIQYMQKVREGIWNHCLHMQDSS